MANLNNAELDFRQLTLLDFDNIILGLPKTDIDFVENLSEVSEQSETELSSGKLVYQLSNLPVYSLNSELEFKSELSPDNRICIVIKNSEKMEKIALMCSSVKPYNIEKNIQLSEVPKIMYNENPPVLGFTKKDNALILLCSAESIGNFIHSSEMFLQQDAENG
jgi:hypothetical protein